MKKIFILVFSLLLTGCSKFEQLQESFLLRFDSTSSVVEGSNNLEEKKILSIYERNFEISKSSMFNAKFNNESASLGHLNPIKFLQEVGAGLYYIDGFVPNKKTILFFHGLGGSPYDWSFVIESLSSEYQAIVVYYPTGIRLDYSSKVIKENLLKLIEEKKIDKLNIVAHSMGGLLAKDIARDLDIRNSVKIGKFITISTPWQGSLRAKNIENLPYAIPSWLDMRPGSLFLKSLEKFSFTKHNIKHYLLFTYKNLSITSKNSDGTISLSSQLKKDAQEDAYKVLGFNETHSTVLNSKDIIKKIESILKEKE